MGVGRDLPIGRVTLGSDGRIAGDFFSALVPLRRVSVDVDGMMFMSAVDEPGLEGLALRPVGSLRLGDNRSVYEAIPGGLRTIEGVLLQDPQGRLYEAQGRVSEGRVLRAYSDGRNEPSRPEAEQDGPGREYRPERDDDRPERDEDRPEREGDPSPPPGAPGAPGTAPPSGPAAQAAQKQQAQKTAGGKPRAVVAPPRPVPTGPRKSPSLLPPGTDKPAKSPKTRKKPKKPAA